MVAEYSHLKFTIMDYLVLGNNGFAKIGNKDYFQKKEIEMDVLLEFLMNNFPIPEEFSDTSNYKIKQFEFEGSIYCEIIFAYDDRIIEKWNDNKPDKFDRFWWDFYVIVESIDLKTEELTERIKNRYLESINVRTGLAYGSSSDR